MSILYLTQHDWYNTVLPICVGILLFLLVVTVGLAKHLWQKRQKKKNRKAQLGPDSDDCTRVIDRLIQLLYEDTDSFDLDRSGIISRNGLSFMDIVDKGYTVILKNSKNFNVTYLSIRQSELAEAYHDWAAHYNNEAIEELMQ